MLEVVKYSKEYESRWDGFIDENSVNGTFLQKWNFLSYHPEERFEDASHMVLDKKNQIVAVVPACVKLEGNEVILFSHAGSTYGGILIDKRWYKASKVIEIIKVLEVYWHAAGFTKVIIKQTPSLFSVEDADLLQYCFYYLGYQCHNELNLYIDYRKYREDILSEFSQGKRTDIHNCIKRGLQYQKISSIEEIKRMHELLSLTLDKYDKKPIHTVDELYDFQGKRLHNECECFGIFDGDEMIAASMMFYFNRVKVAHAQYLCADPQYNRFSPMSYMYYAMLIEMRKKGFEKISWGIGTENLGLYLNEGLVKSKEYYGSKHSVNQVFIKEIK